MALMTRTMAARASWRVKHLFLMLIIVGLTLTWLQIQYALSWSNETKDDLLQISSATAITSSTISAKHVNDELPLSTVFAWPPVPYNRDYPSPVKDLLKVYVYDSLPKVIGKDVEDSLWKLYRNESYDNNWKAELALVQLFRSFPGRTWNPNEADIFVVPYLHAGHCLVHEGWRLGCRHVPNDVFMTQLFPHLAYYNATNELQQPGSNSSRKKSTARHLFFSLAGKDHSHKRIRYHSLLLTAGPRYPENTGHIVVSQFNDAMLFQPSMLLHHTNTTMAITTTNSGGGVVDADYWTRPRKYAFVSHYGEMNAAMRGVSGRRFRRFFRYDMLDYNQSLLGGYPYRLSKLDYGGRNWREERQATYRQYQDSVFCPILPGDMAWQRRFFDAIMSGCLPVVLSWKLSNGETSWFLPEGSTMPTFSISQTYPYPKALYSEQQHRLLLLSVDYESFVVQCPGNTTHEHNVSSLRTTMHNMLMLNSGRNEIRRRQRNMKKEAAIAFSYGLGQDAHRHNDAFARIIRALRYYVDTAGEPTVE